MEEYIHTIYLDSFFHAGYFRPADPGIALQKFFQTFLFFS